MKLKKETFLSNKSIIIWVITLSTLFILTAGYFYYKYQENNIREEKISDLASIAKLKIEQLVQWHKERKGDALVVSHSNSFINNVEKWSNKKADKSVIESILDRLKIYHSVYDYKSVILTNKSLNQELTWDEANEKFCNSTINKINESLKENKIIFTDFYYCPEHKEIHYDIIAPLKDKKRNILGVIIFRIDPKKYLFPLIQSFSTNSKSGETLLIRKEGDSVIFLSPLKFRKDSILNFSIPLTNSKIPAVQAVKGYKGIFEGVDYAGTEVLSYIAPVPGTNWFFVSKISKDEILDELHLVLAIIILTSFLIILAVSGSLVFVYNYRQKNIYRSLWNAEEEYRTTIYSIGDAVITTDSKGLIKQMNPVAEKLTGWSEQESVNCPLEKIFKIINEESRKKILNPIELVLKEGIVTNLANHTLLISKDGKEIPIVDSGAPIKNKIGEIVGVVLVFRDQSIERSNRKKLEESEKRFRMLYENSPISYQSLDAGGRLIDVNPAWLNSLGYARSEVIGKYLGDFMTTESAELFKVRFPAFKAIGEVHNIEFEMERKDGSRILISYEGKVARDEIGNFKQTHCVFSDITERKISEEAIKESSEKYRKLVELSPDAILIHINGKIKFVNEASLLLFGAKAKEELIERNILDLVHPDFRKTVKERISTLVEDNRNVPRIEEKLITINGDIIEAEVTAVPITYSGQKGVQVVARDITQRKKTEAVIKEKDEKLRIIFENSMDGIIIVDANEIITNVNPRITQMLGYSENEMLGKKFPEFIPDEELGEHNRTIRRREKNISEIYERKLKRKDGSTIFTLVSGSSIINSQGEYAGAFGMFTDITERKLAEEEIRKLYRGIEQSPSAVVITNYQGNIEYVNRKFCEVTGYTMEEVIGKNPRILNSGTHSEEFYKNLWNTIVSGNDFKSEMCNKKKNGELYWESVSISPIKNEQGITTHFLGIKEDITERKRFLEELKLAKEKAEEINRVKSSFFANMSHELRTPFVGIMGYAEILRDSLIEPESRYMAEGILESSNRLKETLTKILDITKLDFNKTEVEINEFDLSKVIDDIHKQFCKAAERKKISLTKNVVLNDSKILSDEKLLSEILNNLVNNAIKFTIVGGVEISAIKQIKSGNEKIIIKVIDTGIGIPEDKIDIIWEEFRQASEGHSRSFEGTGLGLAIVKEYTRLLNGEINVESKPGKGTTFILELPCQVNSSIPRKITGKTNNTEPLNEISIKKNLNKKILYVEDDNYARDAMTKILSKYYEVDSASNADNALEKIRNKQYDSILMDINLGKGINGIELTEIIKKLPQYKNIPIIAVTAYATKEDSQEIISKGLTHFMAKPFGSNELLELLDSVIK